MYIMILDMVDGNGSGGADTLVSKKTWNYEIEFHFKKFRTLHTFLKPNLGKFIYKERIDIC